MHCHTRKGQWQGKYRNLVAAKHSWQRCGEITMYGEIGKKRVKERRAGIPISTVAAVTSAITEKEFSLTMANKRKGQSINK